MTDIRLRGIRPSGISTREVGGFPSGIDLGTVTPDQGNDDDQQEIKDPHRS